MTSTKQDKELREAILLEFKNVHRLAPADYTENCTNIVMQLITADRKRVALEARLDENNMYIRELTRHYFPSSPSEPHIPLVQFHERIAELKAQQEEV